LSYPNTYTAWLSLRQQWLLVLTILSQLILFGCQSTDSNTNPRPNILFAISDDQSWIHTSFAGSDWVQTPAFDRVAENGIYFANCYAGSPGCAPSRSALVTGRYHWQNEQAGQHAAGWFAKYVPFVDLLEQNGYHTGYTGKGVGPFKYGEDPLRSQNAAGKAYNEIRYQDGSEKDERFTSHIRDVNYFANFKAFLQDRQPNEPFYFWYGASEPHRSYQKDSWKNRGKSLDQVVVPNFLPDDPVIRGDLLDYAVEIEWFDLHLMRMLDYLETIGELDNTIVVVTADNGMPFPRAKANGYEYGVHVPLAISFPGFPGPRIIEDPVSFVNIAPTLLELTGTSAQGMLPISGTSMASILKSGNEGMIDQSGSYALSGRERHSSSRYQNLGYPQRILRKDSFLYIWNLKPERWPAGAPQRLIPDSTKGALYPLYGIDDQGLHHSDWAFTDIDAAPSKSYIVEQKTIPEVAGYFDWAVEKRPEFEMYDVEKDPDCLTNLVGLPEFMSIQTQMHNLLLEELTHWQDPRVVGPVKDIFDTYPRYSPMREFPKPDWLD
jgi:uncharacterized sulfatase